MSNFAMDVKRTLDGIEKLLIEKNSNYGDSALNPLRIFSKADSIEQIKVRIDDKLSRLSRGEKTINEDTVNDLLGYFVLYKIAENRKIEKSKNPNFENVLKVEKNFA